MLHQPGDVIRDRYCILKSLGQGGMGMTYAAEDRTNGKQVAVKVLSLREITDWKTLELFEREATVLENLNHPAIPTYLEHFQVDTPQDRLFYLVQELAVGDSLAELIQRGWHATEDEVQQIAVQVLEILNYLHRLSPPVIHRDIKPQNIIRQQNGRIVLVDFGAVQATYRNTLTVGRTFVGTFGYMPPEQFRGQAFFASDLYSLGATLLFLLTGRSPADLPQTRMKIEFRDRVAISDDFADWLEHMLEPVVEDRFHSAQAALDALQHKDSRRAIVPHLAHARINQTKPRGSRISLQRKSNHLSVNIPPAGLSAGTLFIAFFALFWNGFVFIWTSLAIASGAPIFFPLFSIPFWLVGLGMIWGVIFAIAGSSYLEIDRHSFQIGWQCLSFGQQYKGRTKDLAGADVDISTNSEGNRSTNFVLWEGVKKRTFGAGLTEVEQQWLATEISDFLTQIQS
jgi:serine/threonine protein kinase